MCSRPHTHPQARHRCSVAPHNSQQPQTTTPVRFASHARCACFFIKQQRAATTRAPDERAAQQQHATTARRQQHHQARHTEATHPPTQHANKPHNKRRHYNNTQQQRITTTFDAPADFQHLERSHKVQTRFCRAPRMEYDPLFVAGQINTCR